MAVNIRKLLTSRIRIKFIPELIFIREGHDMYEEESNVIYDLVDIELKELQNLRKHGY